MARPPAPTRTTPHRLCATPHAAPRRRRRGSPTRDVVSHQAQPRQGEARTRRAERGHVDMCVAVPRRLQRATTGAATTPPRRLPVAALGDVMATRVMARIGFDWLVVDLEHSPIDWSTAATLFGAIADAGGTPLCRVPRGTHENIKRALDAGAHGIVVPMARRWWPEARHAAEPARVPGGASEYLIALRLAGFLPHAHLPAHQRRCVHAAAPRTTARLPAPRPRRRSTPSTRPASPSPPPSTRRKATDPSAAARTS